ncbi:puf family RNA-binding protein [Arthroderma uncinatum]|uniref:puf family RNA-binding protein n=1 Tax=Arthroderma uncinatum TaxID=74035 RepID=UPI00144ADC56|nr:puf family RNA-binding protein [Arthroderma uncinatum]KAF3483244.1 puf family RNA-binding protein [Arthroderma uncinatum]
MAGVKRRADATEASNSKRTKSKSSSKSVEAKGKAKAGYAKASKVTEVESDEDMFDEEDEEDEEEPSNESDLSHSEKEDTHSGKDNTTNGDSENKLSTSRESHAKQKALAQERKAARPNADAIARTKKIWERLRRKSHVPREERKKLVTELYAIITGRVKEFVFKHDSVRVIQTALKYANLEQRKNIAVELKGDYRSLAESKYAKFLLGKLLVHGDAEIRDLIIPEFYGHVKRLVRHPEASWILDDIYRTVATPLQKYKLLREWYGMEFVLMKDDISDEILSLPQILEKSPEKRAPVLQHLHGMINQLIQKKTTGFTMLHDAMLQYFLSTKPGSTEANEFIELLKGDEEGDLAKNLAFTKSGARLMCLALAYSNAKDRKLLLRMYRDTVKLMSGDVHGHTILLVAYEVVDDTKLTHKLLLTELLTQDDLVPRTNDQLARIPLLYSFAGNKNGWLITDTDRQILDEVIEIRSQTSKKDPEVRRGELIAAASPALLECIAANAAALAETSFGARFITEVLFDSTGDKAAALEAVAALGESEGDVLKSPNAGRMLKALVQGGRFNNFTKKVEPVQPPLNFNSLLYNHIKDNVKSWATEWNPFVVVALLESEGFEKRDELIATLKKSKKQLTELASAGSKKPKGEGEEKRDPASSAAKLLLEKIA